MKIFRAITSSTFTQHEFFDCFGYDRQQLVACAEAGTEFAFNISRDTREHEKRKYASNRCFCHQCCHRCLSAISYEEFL